MSDLLNRGGMLAKSIPVRPDSFTVEAEGREIIAYASRFGVIDSDDEMVHRGAFAKSISERVAKGLVRYRSFHREVIGVLKHAEEDGTGLLTVGKVSRVRAGDEMLELIKDRAITTMSFVGKLIKGDTSKIGSRVIKNLREIALFEVGPVDFAANEEAVILAVKDMLSGGIPTEAFERIASKSMWPLTSTIENSESVRRGLDSIVYTMQSHERLSDEEASRVLMMLYALLDDESTMRGKIEPLLLGGSTPSGDAGAGSSTSTGIVTPEIDEEKVSALVLALGGWAAKVNEVKS